jgi:hypothetical protein
MPGLADSTMVEVKQKSGLDCLGEMEKEFAY